MIWSVSRHIGWVACGDPKLLDKFVCVWRARQRTPNTHKLVQKDYLQ